MTAQRSGLNPLHRWTGFALLLAALAAPQAALGDTDPPAIAQAPSSLTVPERLRLLVVAPHPDDETLGAAGLMQRVQKLHGRVSVAYVTSGDGYLDGVELEAGKLRPKPGDFVDYGEERLHEALRALQAISISQKSLFVFGFPDGGLLDLLTTYWSSKRAFVSPYTRDSRPPYPGSLDPGTAYSGVALERELALLITHINPRWIAVTAPWDIHPDHCATFHFVVRALRRLSASNPTFAAPQVLAYTVHRPDWPGFTEGTALAPPPNVSPGSAEWQFLELTASELEGKGQALDQYASQMDIMAVLFRGFVRPNEVFAVYSSLPVEPPDACGRPLPAPVEPASKSR
jgi:LmbE family N-acetylglucosaminyl deacetylase